MQIAPALTVLASLVIGLIVSNLPPLVASGTSSSDPAQVEYAQNVWRATTPWLAITVAISPVLVYGIYRLLVERIEGVALLTASVIALCVAGAFAAQGLSGFAQPPVPVNGKVTSFEGRMISQCDFPPHHLLLSDSELNAAQTWVKPGIAVVLYLTPAGDAAYVGPAQADWPCVHSGLGQ